MLGEATYLAELTMFAASEGGPMGAHTSCCSSRLTCKTTRYFVFSTGSRYKVHASAM